MSAIEHDRANCLPIDAYLHLMRMCSDQDKPKIRSSVFPIKKPNKQQQQQQQQQRKIKK